MSNVFCLVVVKNEADIIYDTIKSASLWAKKIIVMDNMSTDNTWEVLSKLNEELDNLILWGRYEGKFNEGLRQILFREYRHLAGEDDWWCRLDGDEFYIDNPNEFIHSLSANIDHIYNASFQYYYTEEDMNYDLEDGSIINARDRLKWYKCNHSEIRFVRNSANICWPQCYGWPINMKKPANKRIRLKHYQYRSLMQIKERFYIRSTTKIGDTFKHEIVTANEWYQRRGFSVPLNIIHKQYRIVNKNDLECALEYHYDDSKLAKIENYNFKKKLKNYLINSYMRYLNKRLFSL